MSVVIIVSNFTGDVWSSFSTFVWSRYPTYVWSSFHCVWVKYANTSCNSLKKEKEKKRLMDFVSLCCNYLILGLVY